MDQSITVPDSPTVTLRLWMYVNTAEAPSASDDTLQVRIDGDVVATFSNLQANNSYTRRTISLAAYAGDDVTLGFFGNENASQQTMFLLDDVRVTPS
ncbi:MAG: hypothetical protein ACRDQD_16700 [Nocardioidaceae bacterium]